jgi:hypothetical protein
MSRPTISERAIAAREARHRARKSREPDGSPKPIDPWETAGPPGTWGRGNSQERPEPADGWQFRALEALNNGSNRQFERIVAQVSRMFDW